MSKKMKALVKKEAKPGIWMEEVDIPEVGTNDVLVKMHYTSICGTDIHIYEWNEWAQDTIPVPMVVGHEYVGEVVEIGIGVDNCEVGDIVTGEGHVVCGKCRNCLKGVRHLCPNTEGIGVNRPGIFGEFAAIPATNIVHTVNGIDEKLYSIFDPFGNAVHTALSFDLVGEDVLVTGAGPIGIMAAAVAQHVGARNVVLTDLIPYRIELAKKMGIKHVYDTSKVAIKDIQEELGMVQGFDVGMEMSGNDIAFNDMIDNMIMGGKIAMLGVQGPETKVDWNKIVFGGLQLKGIYGREMYETWYMMQALIESGLDISPIITHTLPIDDFEEGFEIMASGDSGKIVLDWEA